MSLKALIFDVDGTLAESEETHRAAFNRAFADFDLDWHWDQQLYGDLLKVMGGKERLRHYASAYTPPGGERVLKDGFIGKLHARKTEVYGALVEAGEIELRPGVARLLAEAHEAGIWLAIATTTTLSNVVALFEGTIGRDKLTWFSAIAAGDMVHDKKPAPDIFKLALERLGLPPRDCMAIEDTHHGLMSAVEAALPTVVTVSRYTGGQDFSAALATLTGLGEPGTPARGLGGMAHGDVVVTPQLLASWHTRASHRGGRATASA